MVPFRGVYRIAATAAVVHLVCVALTAWYVSTLDLKSAEAISLWVLWLVIDFPVSVMQYFVLDGHFFLVEAVVGSLWWFLLIIVVTRIVQAIRRRFA